MPIMRPQRPSQLEGAELLPSAGEPSSSAPADSHNDRPGKVAASEEASVEKELRKKFNLSVSEYRQQRRAARTAFLIFAHKGKKDGEAEGISKDDIADSLAELDIEVTEDKFEKWFDKVDKNNDGTISEREFLEIFLRATEDREKAEMKGKSGGRGSHIEQVLDPSNLVKLRHAQRSAEKHFHFNLFLYTLFVMAFPPVLLLGLLDYRAFRTLRTLLKFLTRLAPGVRDLMRRNEGATRATGWNMWVSANELRQEAQEESNETTLRRVGRMAADAYNVLWFTALWVLVLFIAIAPGARGLSEVTRIEQFSPLVIYGMSFLMLAFIVSFQRKPKMQELAMSELSAFPVVLANESVTADVIVEDVLAAAGQQMRALVNRLDAWVEFGICMIGAAPHALLPIIFRGVRNGWHNAFVSSDSGHADFAFEITVILLSAFASFYLLTRTLYILTLVTKRVWGRYFRLRHFTATTKIDEALRMQVPFVSLSVPGNVVAWSKIRMYFQAAKLTEMRWLQVVASFAAFVLLVIAGLMNLYFILSLDLRGLGALLYVGAYDIFLALSYLWTVFKIGGEINKAKEMDIAMIRLQQWKISQELYSSGTASISSLAAKQIAAKSGSARKFGVDAYSIRRLRNLSDEDREKSLTASHQLLDDLSNVIEQMDSPISVLGFELGGGVASSVITFSVTGAFTGVYNILAEEFGLPQI